MVLSFGMKYIPLMLFQLVLMVLFFVFVKYSYGEPVPSSGFEGTHVMIFIGFGFLMTFLKKYCYSALGFNFLLAAMVIQWAIICQNAFTMTDSTIFITRKTLLEADIMSATVLITFGALLGVASDVQLLFIAFVETIVASVNIYLVSYIFKAADVGGSIAIHTFGAYFGLGASLGLMNREKTEAANQPPSIDLNGASYTSDVTAMIGSIFLWVYWPSFNSGLTETPAEYERACINTYLSLAACTVTSFVLSSILSENEGKFDMVHIQNSTLAGGVAVGSVCNMFIGAGGAIAVGIGSAIISVLGYRFLTPKLTKLGLLDTCGVNNLHGMPGVFSGLLSILFASLAAKGDYGDDYGKVFAAMTEDSGRKPGSQAAFQFYALAATIGISLVSGFVTGYIAKMSIFAPVKVAKRYNDELNWELP